MARLESFCCKESVALQAILDLPEPAPEKDDPDFIRTFLLTDKYTEAREKYLARQRTRTVG